MNGQSPPPIRNLDKPLPETSFYYKESSLSEASGSYHPGEFEAALFNGFTLGPHNIHQCFDPFSANQYKLLNLKPC